MIKKYIVLLSLCASISLQGSGKREVIRVALHAGRQLSLFERVIRMPATVQQWWNRKEDYKSLQEDGSRADLGQRVQQELNDIVRILVFAAAERVGRELQFDALGDLCYEHQVAYSPLTSRFGDGALCAALITPDFAEVCTAAVTDIFAADVHESIARYFVYRCAHNAVFYNTMQETIEDALRQGIMVMAAQDASISNQAIERRMHCVKMVANKLYDELRVVPLLDMFGLRNEVVERDAWS